MWFGLLHLSPGQGDDVEDETVIIVAYEPHRLFRVAAPLAVVTQPLVFLHQAADRGRNVVAPRCGSCGAEWELPPLDEEEPACASA